MNSFVFSKIGKNITFLMVGLMLLIAPKLAYASFITNTDLNHTVNSQDLNIIKNALENKKVTQQLAAFGYSKAEIEDSLAKLTDEEIHQLAGQLDGALNPSGSGAGVALVVAVVFLVALGIWKLIISMVPFDK